EAVARTVGDPFLHAAMMDAARASRGRGGAGRGRASEAPASRDDGRPRGISRFARRGVEVYRSAPLDVPGDARIDIDLVLPDGTHRRFAAPPTGRLLVVGLPYGRVQARVEVRPPASEGVVWPPP